MNSKTVSALPAVEGDLREAMEHYASWHPEWRPPFPVRGPTPLRPRFLSVSG